MKFIFLKFLFTVIVVLFFITMLPRICREPAEKQILYQISLLCYYHTVYNYYYHCYYNCVSSKMVEHVWLL